MCNVSIIIAGKPDDKTLSTASQKIWKIALESMYVSSLKYHIESTVFMPSDRCVCPEITHSQYLSVYLPKQADSTESFTSQKSSLTSSWNLSREKLKKKNDWVPTVILERKRKIKTTESQNDSQITENSQIETESLSDLNVQRQYYYCKSDNETLLNASQKIWEFENLKNCFRITHKVLGCVLNVCELTKIPHCLPMDD